MKNEVIIVTGPTASGKTDVSIKLAKKINGEIINADSMQIYKGFNIITNKPTKEELNLAKHHLIDFVDINKKNYKNFTVYRYENLAKRKINEVLKRGKIPIISGGTGLYIDSIIFDFTYEGKVKSYTNLLNDNLSYKFILLSPKNYDERKILYDKINNRVEKMFATGITKEAKKLHSLNLKDNFAIKKAIGYKEFIPYFENKQKDLERIKEEIKKNTRHYAKRQITWMKKYENFPQFSLDV